MKARFPTAIRAVRTLAMLSCAASVVSDTVPGVKFGAGTPLKAASQAGFDLHAEHGHFGAIGALIGIRLQVPVISTTCKARAYDGTGCAGRG